MSVLWCITGAGHFLEESVEVMENVSDKLVVLFSNAGVEVAKMYGLYDRISASATDVIYEKDQGYSSPIVGRVSSGGYGRIIVSPCTANTVAKIALGIADSLVSNVVAQAIKGGRKVWIVPTDYEERIETVIPPGRKVSVHCRKVDLHNLEKIKRMRGIEVILHPSKIKEILEVG
jgi:flavoprotein